MVQVRAGFFYLLAAVFLFSLGAGALKPILPNYALSLGASYLIVGSVISGLGYSRVFIEIPLGMVIDRYGRKRIAMAGVLFSAIGALLGSLAVEISSLFLFIILSGLSSSLFFASTFAIINDLAPPEKTGSYFGSNIAAIFLGPIFGPLLGGYLASSYGLRTPFIISLIIAVIALLFVIIGTRELMEKNIHNRDSVSNRLSYIQRLFRSKRLIFINSLGFLNPFTMSCIASTILPIYGGQFLGLNFTLIGVIFSVMSFSSFLVSAPSGFISDKLGRAPLLTIGFSLFTAANFLFPYTNNFLVLLFPSILLGLGDGLISPSMWASLSDVTVQEEKAISIGVFRTFIAAGLIAGPLVAGIVMSSQNIAVSFYLASLISLSATIVNIIFIMSNK